MNFIRSKDVFLQMKFLSKTIMINITSLVPTMKVLGEKNSNKLINLRKELREAHKNHSPKDLLLNHMLLTYIFTTSADLNNFFSSAIAEIRITKGQSWEKYYYIGNVLPLLNFNPDSKDTLRRQLQVYLFQKDHQNILNVYIYIYIFKYISCT